MGIVSGVQSQVNGLNIEWEKNIRRSHRMKSAFCAAAQSFCDHQMA
jgi:hypothetical protein